jgi:hypothetical protein
MVVILQETKEKSSDAPFWLPQWIEAVAVGCVQAPLL